MLTPKQGSRYTSLGLQRDVCLRNRNLGFVYIDRALKAMQQQNHIENECR